MGRSRKPAGQKKPPLTHFLCLPLVTSDSRPKLENALAQFGDTVAIRDGASAFRAGKEDENGLVAQETAIRCVHPKAIRPVGALHCTLGVMSLSKQDLSKAVDLLGGLDVVQVLKATHDSGVTEQPWSSKQPVESKPKNGPASLERPISPPSITRDVAPLVIDLRGLVSMHAPHQISILYSAPSDSSGRLRDFCLAVQKIFKDATLLVPDDRELKLHATIVNTIYAKSRKRPPRGSAKQQTSEPVRIVPTEQPDIQATSSTATGHNDAQREQSEDGKQGDRSQGHGPNANAPLKIDATAILEKFGTFVWAENVALDRIAICEMGAKKIMNAAGMVVAEEYIEVASVRLPT
ncbi:hypothetical protein LTR08_000891 [Meristemomyces frigidus]|nr:hypothetical protein LTR08_000891 [Meristemomyces frigidus]